MAVDKAARFYASARLSFAFFGMSVVMLAVMGVSMWKDTHPEWRAYQEKFSALEKKVLLEEKADIIRQIEHPDYEGDYQKEKKALSAAQSKFDEASGALEQTEADLEEKELAAKGGDPEGEPDNSGTGKPTAVSSVHSAPATKDELADLDKEFSDSSGGTAATAPAKKASKPAAPAKTETKPAAPGKATKAEEDELDKEFQGADAPKGQAEESAKPAPKAPAKQPEAKAPAKASSSEEAELDKEFRSADAPKGSNEQANEAPAPAGKSAAPTEVATSYDEAKLAPDEARAETKVDAAKRALLVAQSKHAKEMIGLPEADRAKRDLADARLKEAEQMLALAQASLVLEQEKTRMKGVAEVAEWAHDAALKDAGAQAKLNGHIEGLKRELRLVEGRLERNASLAPEIEQTYIENLGNIDRCATCHRATDDKRFSAAPEPFRTHPGNMLKWHPVERFGCSACHGGWGNALEKAEAHGELVGKGSPLLAGDKAQASCGKCHGDTKELPGDALYLEGAQLFRTSGCLGCHKVESISGEQKQGPSLNGLGQKVNAAWLVQWLKNPRSHSLDARMPNFGLKQEEAEAAAAYLLGQGNNEPAMAPATIVEPAQTNLESGRRLVEKLGCQGCHMIKGEGTAVGPELTNIRHKVEPQWLYSWIENPKKYMPDSRMPVFGLTHEQALQIGDYLLSVGKDHPAPTSLSASIMAEGAAKRGQQLITERGCGGCHNIKGFDRIAAPDLTHEGEKAADVLEFGNAKGVKRDLFDYAVAKLKDPAVYDTAAFKSKMPKFGLNDQEIKALGIYILSLTAPKLPPEYTKDIQDQNTPILAGRRLFMEHNCIACHQIAGQGGKVGPNLTREGEKVQPTWLFGFIENPSRIRWWQDARMPNFHLTQAEATILTEYLMELSNQPAPYQFTPPEQLVFPLALAGQKKFVDLKCQSCHPLGGKQAVVGGDTKKLGPDLELAPKRLKADWMLRFLHDPQAVDPGTQMPTFKESDQTFRSIIDFLMKPK